MKTKAIAQFKNVLMVLFLTTTIPVVLLSSCKKDDEPEVSYNEAIIGKWEIESRVVTSYVNGQKVEQNTNTYDAGYLSIEFRTDKTVECVSFESGSTVGTYQIDDNELTWSGPISTEMTDSEIATAVLALNGKLTMTYTMEEEYEGVKYKSVLVYKLRKL